MSAYLRSNFTRAELACPCCGIAHISQAALDKLQALRDRMGPLTINSAARCPQHNKSVGGAANSQHLSTPQRASTAFDIALDGHDKQTLIDAARAVGFQGLGIYYRSFVHVDDRGFDAVW